MEISLKKIDTCNVIELNGRLNTTNFSDLEKEINRLIEKGERYILVDCERLDYVSSSGLRVFLVALKTLKKNEGKFILCNIQENIKEIFEVSGFITIFEIYQTKNEALKNCK
jgi:anti-anti-sigma factor